MRSYIYYIFQFNLLLLVSCAEFSGYRSFTSLEEEGSNFFNPSKDFPVVAGDEGLGPDAYQSASNFNEKKESLLEKQIPTVETKSSMDEPQNSSQVRNFFRLRSAQIGLGMTKEDILDNFGKPMKVEVAGNPSYENERWLYRLNGATKYIYFESGRVGGWE